MITENEISGDVLVDMDMNSLKEIDIIAFGPRARIAKAIKELRGAFESTSVLSPGMSLYEADTSSIRDSNRGSSIRAGSLRDERFSQSVIPITPTSPSGLEDIPGTPPPVTTPMLSYEDPLTGLGLQQSISATQVQDSSTDLPAKATSTRAGQIRDNTDESFNTANGATEDLRQDSAVPAVRKTSCCSPKVAAEV